MDQVRESTGEPKEIRASTEEEIVSERVPKNTRQTGNRIRESIRESKTERIVSERVPEKYSDEY